MSHRKVFRKHKCRTFIVTRWQSHILLNLQKIVSLWSCLKVKCCIYFISTLFVCFKSEMINIFLKCTIVHLQCTGYRATVMSTLLSTVAAGCARLDLAGAAPPTLDDDDEILLRDAER